MRANKLTSQQGFYFVVVQSEIRLDRQLIRLIRPINIFIFKTASHYSVVEFCLDILKIHLLHIGLVGSRTCSACLQTKYEEFSFNPSSLWGFFFNRKNCESALKNILIPHKFKQSIKYHRVQTHQNSRTLNLNK